MKKGVSKKLTAEEYHQGITIRQAKSSERIYMLFF